MRALIIACIREGAIGTGGGGVGVPIGAGGGGVGIKVLVLSIKTQASFTMSLPIFCPLGWMGWRRYKALPHPP